MKRFVDFLIGVPLITFLSIFRRRKAVSGGEAKKILIIKLAAAGDTVLLMPVIHSIKKTFPNVEIDWLVSKINIQLARRSSDVRKIFNLKNISIINLLTIIRELRKESYDICIDFEQWSRGSALIGFLSGAKVVYGFDTPGQCRSSLFTKSVKKTFDQHEINEFFNLAETVGKLMPYEIPTLKESKEGDKELFDLLSNKEKKSKWVLFHPGCGADGTPREWPLEEYAILGNWLKINFKVDLFISGGPDEVQKAGTLLKLLNQQAINMAGNLSWEGTLSLLSKMDLIISGNTGVMHIAAALNKNQIALHGPTNPILWGPLNSNAHVIQTSCPKCPCLKLGYEYHALDQSCMKQIPLDRVKQEILTIFDKEKSF